MIGTALRAREHAKVAPPKPRIRILANGWIRHGREVIGFPKGLKLDVVLACGMVDSGRDAEHWPNSWWSNTHPDGRWHIRFYRASPPPVPILVDHHVAEEVVRGL